MPSSSTPLTSSRPNLLDALFIVRLLFLDVLVVSSRRRLSRPAEATLATPAPPFRRCRRRSHPKGVKFDRTTPCGGRDALGSGGRSRGRFTPRKQPGGARSEPDGAAYRSVRSAPPPRRAAQARSPGRSREHDRGASSRGSDGYRPAPDRK